MAIDGTGIIASDLAHDVYNDILDMFDEGVEPVDILPGLAPSYDVEAMDDLEHEIYLVASAKALWEIGHLPAELIKQLVDFIQNGKSFELWEIAGNRALSKERQAVLARFMKQISVPKATPRLRKVHAKTLL